MQNLKLKVQSLPCSRVESLPSVGGTGGDGLLPKFLFSVFV